MKIQNHISEYEEDQLDEMEVISRHKGPVAQVADNLLHDFDRETGFGYGCGGPPYETRILLYVSPYCEFESETFFQLVQKFNYHFYFTHCYILQSHESMPSNTIEVIVFSCRIQNRESLLYAARDGSFNAVAALGCSAGFPNDWYSPYFSNGYCLNIHMTKLLIFAPVSIPHLRALAQACRVGLMVDCDERLATIFERCAEIAAERYDDEELEEYASYFNEYEDPQYIFFSDTAADRQYVYDWLKRMADDWDCPLRETAYKMLSAYKFNDVLNAVGIHLPEPDENAPF